MAKKKLHNLPDELTAWESDDKTCIWCSQHKPEILELELGTVVGIYKLLRVGTMQTKAFFEPLDGTWRAK